MRLETASTRAMIVRRKNGVNIIFSSFLEWPASGDTDHCVYTE